MHAPGLQHKTYRVLGSCKCVLYGLNLTLSVTIEVLLLQMSLDIDSVQQNDSLVTGTNMTYAVEQTITNYEEYTQ